MAKMEDVWLLNWRTWDDEGEEVFFWEPDVEDLKNPTWLMVEELLNALESAMKADKSSPNYLPWEEVVTFLQYAWQVQMNKHAAGMWTPFRDAENPNDVMKGIRANEWMMVNLVNMVVYRTRRFKRMIESLKTGSDEPALNLSEMMTAAELLLTVKEPLVSN